MEQNNSNLMMLAMLGMCLVSLFLFALIPLLGVAGGIAVGLVAGILMLLLHWKLMGSSSNHRH